MVPRRPRLTPDEWNNLDKDGRKPVESDETVSVADTTTRMLTPAVREAACAGIILFTVAVLLIAVGAPTTPTTAVGGLATMATLMTVTLSVARHRSRHGDMIGASHVGDSFGRIAIATVVAAALPVAEALSTERLIPIPASILPVSCLVGMSVGMLIVRSTIEQAVHDSRLR